MSLFPETEYRWLLNRKAFSCLQNSFNRGGAGTLWYLLWFAFVLSSVLGYKKYFNLTKLNEQLKGRLLGVLEWTMLKDRSSSKCVPPGKGLKRLKRQKKKKQSSLKKDLCVSKNHVFPLHLSCCIGCSNNQVVEISMDWIIM